MILRVPVLITAFIILVTAQVVAALYIENRKEEVGVLIFCMISLLSVGTGMYVLCNLGWL